MRTWIRPMIIEECFVSNESIANSVAACYKIACDVRSTGVSTYGSGWGYAREYGSNISHSPLGTAGTCADANANRIITTGTVGQELPYRKTTRSRNVGQMVKLIALYLALMEQ